MRMPVRFLAAGRYAAPHPAHSLLDNLMGSTSRAWLRKPKEHVCDLLNPSLHPLGRAKGGECKSFSSLSLPAPPGKVEAASDSPWRHHPNICRRIGDLLSRTTRAMRDNSAALSRLILSLRKKQRKKPTRVRY
jgi:hypothetical protein